MIKENDNNQDMKDKSEIDIKNKDSYHHGDLRESMIRMGAKLLAEDGTEKFSLRKLATMCNVSHAAPYKHFKNKEELIEAIKEYIDKEFADALREVTEKYKDNPIKKITELGKRYVSFMVENKDYLKLLFLNSNKYNVKVSINDIENYNYEPFRIFKDNALEALKFANADPAEYGKSILAMWATVHGLAVMISNSTIFYDGDYLDLVEQILTSNVRF
ncbi:TetR/AcrR family transcriptional regulator [uncultured Clostridium sp.]|uniref:TetR/AcrR family transcriptional regulator n=1 Tax=uncultured Clostridium sp. TaxID=59620 RepID=UPI0025EE9133|nr:TetR/AcrR family transcriptional regulator [uncultured Clostridium sp.]